MTLVHNCFSMILFRATRNIVLATMVLYGNAEPSGAEKATQLHAGVLVIYDRKMYDGIRDLYGHEYNAVRGTPDAYFSAFLRAVQLTFRDMKNVNIRISLVDTYLLGEDVARDIAASVPGYYETINGTTTLKKLQEKVLSKSKLYKQAHAAFFVTTKYILTKNETGEWTGTPKRGGICEEGANVGLVTDDGKTFTGVRETAEQIATLLGASLESNCSYRPYYMPPSVFHEDLSILSSCSKNEITEFLSQEEKTMKCPETVPVMFTKSEEVLPNIYNNITGYDVCTAGTSPDRREVRQCEKGDGRSNFNTTCRVQCCEYRSRFARKGQPISLGGRGLADGAPCGSKKICVHGKCEDLDPQL